MIETDIKTRLLANGTLSAIVGSGVYLMRAEQVATRPYVIINSISKRRFPSSAGPNGMVSTRVQVDSYGNTYLQAKSMANAIRLSLNGLTGDSGDEFVRMCLIDSENDVDESPLTGKDKGPARVSQDFIVQHRETTS